MNLDHLLDNAIAMGFDEDTIHKVLEDSIDKLTTSVKPTRPRDAELTHHLAVWIKKEQKKAYDQLVSQAKAEGILEPHQKIQDYIRLLMHRVMIEAIKGNRVLNPRTAVIY